jgi:hypothetical protein
MSENKQGTAGTVDTKLAQARSPAVPHAYKGIRLLSDEEVAILRASHARAVAKAVQTVRDRESI